jgi:hypothetical protein
MNIRRSFSMKDETIRWVCYVNHHDIPQYEACGWFRPTTTMSYPRLDHYGATLEWRGEGDPPVPERDHA